MSLDRVLSQEEIDSVFRNLQKNRPSDDPARRAMPYDFRRPDRIAKDQLRAIHLLHDNFARSLASSLSAFLRAYVMVNLVSVEQISFLEFTQCLPSPTCIAALSMKPFDSSAILEMNPAMVFPLLEILLGGTGRSNLKLEREVTEIEQSILDGIYRIILHDLHQAWAPITTIRFAVDAHETEPQLLQILAPNEAVVAIGMEIRIGDVAGMMNLGIPSIIIKMLRQKFDQQWSVRKSESNEDDRARMLRLLASSHLKMDARLRGPQLTVEEVLNLEPGDVLAFDQNLNWPLDLMVNGYQQFQGRVVALGRKKALRIDNVQSPQFRLPPAAADQEGDAATDEQSGQHDQPLHHSGVPRHSR